jgi:hypothetical protein
VWVINWCDVSSCFQKRKTRRRAFLEKEKIACIFMGPGCCEGLINHVAATAALFLLQLKC